MESILQVPQRAGNNGNNVNVFYSLKGHIKGQITFAHKILYTCVLRSWVSCLRRSVAFCCRPCRWSCICKRPTLFTCIALEGGGGIRARGADGVLAANQQSRTRGLPGGRWETNRLVCCARLRWDLQPANMTHSTNNTHTHTYSEKSQRNMHIEKIRERTHTNANTHWILCVNAKTKL